MTPEKLETGYISINFDSIDDAIEEAFDALDAYDERYDYFNDILETMREIDTSTLGVGVYDIQETCIAIEDKMNAIMRQKNGVAGKKDIVVAYKENAMNIENAVANHINTTLQDFCDANGIEYEDDSNPVWEFICDIGDAICDFYEDFKRIIDVIVDVVAFIAAAVAVVAAAAALAVASGFIAVAAAIAGVVTAVFTLYENACSLMYSSAALYEELSGNEEAAQRYSNIRDNGAGEYVFVQRLAACGIDSETASAIYGGIEVTMEVLEIVSSAGNMALSVKKAVTGCRGDKFQKVLAGIKVCFKGEDGPSEGFKWLFNGGGELDADEVMKIYNTYDRFDTGAGMMEDARDWVISGVEGDESDMYSDRIVVDGDIVGGGEIYDIMDSGLELIDIIGAE